MENFYEEIYQYLINEGIADEEAIEVVNHLHESNVHEYGLITENKSKAILNVLKAVGYASGILKTPGAKQAVKATTKKITSGTARQGNLLTKTGKAQNFTGNKTPFISTSPVPAASSPLPKAAPASVQTPGQMRIPGMSDTAMDLSRITGKSAGSKGGSGLTMGSRSTSKVSRQAPKPEFGPGAVTPKVSTPKAELRPGGKTPKPEFGTPTGLTTKVKSTPKTNRQADAVSALQKTQPIKAPKVDGPSAMTIAKGDKVVYSIPKKDVLTPSQMKAQRVADKMRALKIAGGIGVVGGAAALVDKSNTDGAARRAERELQKDIKLAQQKAETKAADAPKLEPTGERSAKANAEKQEKSKQEAENTRRSKEQLSGSAKNFDKAFASARKSGKSQFTWRGKKYTTKLKGE